MKEKIENKKKELLEVIENSEAKKNLKKTIKIKVKCLIGCEFRGVKINKGEIIEMSIINYNSMNFNEKKFEKL